MWARQMAWLGGAVKGTDGKPTSTSRAQQIQADGGTMRLPTLQAPHLAGYLQDMGFCMQGAMGPVPISSSELSAWCAGMRRRLAEWEFAAIRAASKAYCTQLHEDTSTPPYGELGDLSDPAVLNQRIAKSLSGLARPVKRSKKATS